MTAIDPHNSRRRTNKSPCNRNGFSLANRLEFDEIREFAGDTIFRLDRPQTQGISQRRDVNRVYFSSTGFFQKSLQYISRDRACLELVNLPAVIDRKNLTALRPDLAQEASKLFAKRQVRGDHRERPGIDVRNVDRISDYAFQQN